VGDITPLAPETSLWHRPRQNAADTQTRIGVPLLGRCDLCWNKITQDRFVGENKIIERSTFAEIVAVCCSQKHKKSQTAKQVGKALVLLKLFAVCCSPKQKAQKQVGGADLVFNNKKRNATARKENKP
jgi:hypothetical protein